MIVLDDRIDEFAEMVREYYSLEDIQGPTETSEVCRFLSSEGFLQLIKCKGRSSYCRKNMYRCRN
jgi:hypothetical protein